MELPSGLDTLDQQLLDQLVGQARERGVKLAGESGLPQAPGDRTLSEPVSRLARGLRVAQRKMRFNPMLDATLRRLYCE